jgi:hypothetical protein
MRTLDDDKHVYVCKAPKGPYAGKELVEPVHCDAYSEGRTAHMPSELSQRLEAALSRISKRTDREED